MVPVEAKTEAIKFLFPSLGRYTQAYKEICEYIEKKVEVSRCCVLYALDQDFEKIASKYHLDLGTKEVIIANGCVSATEDYHNVLRVICYTKPFSKPKDDIFKFITQKD